ncbi:glycosyltransferase [Merismopedia glauca]|nr:glycosyltransferase [Merismopedia glauca]
MFLTTGLSTGGAEKMLYSLLSQINRAEFTPVVVSLIPGGTIGDRFQDLSIPVHTIGLKAGAIPNPIQLIKLRKYVHQIQPDIIQGWMYHGNLAASLSRNFIDRKIPIFWSIHHSIKTLSAERLVLRNIIKIGIKFAPSCQQVIFVSQASKLQHEALGYSQNNSCVIPNGFNLETFVPSLESQRQLRQELRLPSNAFLVGKFARYHPMKDHQNFLKAAALLNSKYSDVHFILAGTDISTNNSELTQLIQHLGINNQVHLLGERQDMAHLTAALDIATVASAYGEAFPLVVGEAMSCQVPCVVTDVGDAGEIVGNTGKVVPPQNPQALATAWQELIELGTEGRGRLGIAARNRIIANFSLEKVVDQYEQLWRLSNK